MTRETRIGLLVGLLFIIMFGLVLSGLTSTGAPPGAPSLGVPVNPAAANTAPPEDVREIGWAPAMDPERRPVPVSGDPATRPAEGTASAGRTTGSGTGEVAVAWPREMPGGAPTPPAPAERAGTDPATTVHTGASETMTFGDTIPGAHRPDEAAGARHVDAMHPIEVIPAGSRTDPAAPPPGSRIYEVKQGDTFYRIARMEYGPAFVSKHTLILEANKDKLNGKGAAGLKPGMKLVIPPLPEAGTPAAGTPTPTSHPSTPEGEPGTPGHPHSRTDIVMAGPGPGSRATGLTAHTVDESTSRPGPVVAKTYIVKQGDTIRTIARATGTTQDKILKANRVDPRKLKIGMKLEIPA